MGCRYKLLQKCIDMKYIGSAKYNAVQYYHYRYEQFFFNNFNWRYEFAADE